MTWRFTPRDLSVGSRLAAFAVLAHDPAVPAIAADWWEISAPWYRSVMRALAELVAGRPAEEALDRLAAAPEDTERETALADALDRLLATAPADRARLEGLMAKAREHMLIGYHRGEHADRCARPVTLGDLEGDLPFVRPPRPPSGAGGPHTLVVIPFRDRTGGTRTRNLLACLAALRDQRARGGDITITVVESDSFPRWRAKIEPRVDRYVFAPYSGRFNKAWAVNVGVRQAGPGIGLICVLDADILVDDRFVARNLARHEENPHLVAFLPYRNMYGLDPSSTHAAIRSRCLHRRPGVSLDEIRALVLREPPGACLWARADVYHDIGGFDERYEGWGGEDDDVVTRLARAGDLARFDDPLIHLSHPRPPMTVGGRPFNAHLEVGSWTAPHGYGDLRGPAVAAR